jgi:hypothetical protein
MIDTHPPAPVIPSKRPDDEVQFIRCNPVKKQKTSDTTCRLVRDISGPPQKARQPVSRLPSPTRAQLQLPCQPQAASSNMSSVAVSTPSTGYMTSFQGENDPHNRRVTTGMVARHAVFPDIGNIIGTGGNPLLPVLDGFTFDQPLGRSKPLMSPAMSPRQLSQAVGPMPLAQAHSHVMGNGASVHAMRPSANYGQALPRLDAREDPTMIDSRSSAIMASSPPLTLTSPFATSALDTTAAPTHEPAATSECASQDTSRWVGSTFSAKPCRICERRWQQELLFRNQGMPSRIHQSASPHDVPYQSPYALHTHAQSMAMTAPVPNLPSMPFLHHRQIALEHMRIPMNMEDFGNHAPLPAQTEVGIGGGRYWSNMTPLPGFEGPSQAANR